MSFPYRSNMNYARKKLTTLVLLNIIYIMCVTLFSRFLINLQLNKLQDAISFSNISLV